MPQRGTTGLFYCGQKRDYKCGCCDAYCGPTNGCNCTSCKKLDALYFAPKKSTNGKYYCGRKVLKCYCCDGHCGPTNGCNCKDCQQYQIKEKQEQKKQQNSFIEFFQRMSLGISQPVKAQENKKVSQSVVVLPKEEYKDKEQKREQQKQFRSQIIGARRQPHHEDFFDQLCSLNLSPETINILQAQAINDWEVLNTMTKQDFVSLKIKFGDVMRIISAIKK